jgi:hypothetical protein
MAKTDCPGLLLVLFLATLEAPEWGGFPCPESELALLDAAMP